MVDRLLCCDDKAATTVLQVREDNLFCEGGVMAATGIIENIAQTCAARIGYQTLSDGKAVKIGVIGAISKMSINELPKVGDTITTHIEIEEEVFGMTLVRAEVKKEGIVIAETSMKIALTDEEAGG